MRIKICGITRPDQGAAIANMGATALGFICVQRSPRYIQPDRIRDIVEQLPAKVDRVGVFADASIAEIIQVVKTGNLNAVQLHGNETLPFCQQLREALPGVELIRALRVRSPQQLEAVDTYQGYVDTLLLDAYHPGALGGTGMTLDWSSLNTFRPFCPWLLAGGLTPENVSEALHLTSPNGIDLSSGVESAPGDKDLQKVANLFQQLDRCKAFNQD